MSTLLNQGIIQGVLKNADIGLSSDKSAYSSGETVKLSGVLNFAEAEEVFIHQVALVAVGPGSQDLDVALPLQAGTTHNLTGLPGVSGTLTAKVTFTDLVLPGGTLPDGGTLPSGTLPGGTLPGSVCVGDDPSIGTLPSGTLPGDTLPSTLPGGTLPDGVLPGGTLPGGITGGGQLKGIGDTGRIDYAVSWLPTTPGSYRAQLVVIAVGPQGCTVSRSPIINFSLSAPTPTETPTATEEEIAEVVDRLEDLAEQAEEDPEAFAQAVADIVADNPVLAGAALAVAAVDNPEQVASAIIASAEDNAQAAGQALAAAAQRNPDAVGATIVAASRQNAQAAGLAIAAAASSDAGSTGQALATAAASNAEATGDAVAAAAAVDPESTGNAVAVAAANDPEATGGAVAAAASRDPEATGNAVAEAAQQDPEATGNAVAEAAVKDPEATGNAVAAAASRDPEATGGALTSSVKRNAQATGNALLTASKTDAASTGEALASGPAQDPEALADLGEHIPVEPWVPEDAPEVGSNRHGPGFWEDVGSPAPIENILGKYARTIPKAKVNVSDIPIGTLQNLTALPERLVVNSFLSLSPEGFLDSDFVAGHVTLFVEKSWLDQNQVHQWSLQFSRFDEPSNSWRPVQAKRVREDESRVFFSVVVPGFSKWIIAGSAEAPDVQFLIENLTVSADPKTNQDVTIQVSVTNLTSEEAELNLALWVDQQIDSMVRQLFAPGESGPVVFTLVPKNVGETEIRVDRLIASVNVAEGPPVTPTPVPIIVLPGGPERGSGLVVGIIVGALAAIFVAGTAVAIYLGASQAPVAPTGSRGGTQPSDGEDPGYRKYDPLADDVSSEDAVEGEDSDPAEEELPG